MNQSSIEEKTAFRVKHYGLLFKRSRYLMSMNARYTILTEDELITFSDKQFNDEPTGVYPIEMMVEVEDVPNHAFKTHWGFKLKLTKEVLFFEAETQGTRNDWVESLRAVIGSFKNVSLFDKKINSNWSYINVKKKRVKENYDYYFYSNLVNKNNYNINIHDNSPLKNNNNKNDGKNYLGVDSKRKIDNFDDSMNFDFEEISKINIRFNEPSMIPEDSFLDIRKSYKVHGNNRDTSFLKERESINDQDRSKLYHNEIKNYLKTARDMDENNISQRIQKFQDQSMIRMHSAHEYADTDDDDENNIIQFLSKEKEEYQLNQSMNSKPSTAPNSNQESIFQDVGMGGNKRLSYKQSVADVNYSNPSFGNVFKPSSVSFEPNGIIDEEEEPCIPDLKIKNRNDDFDVQVRNNSRKSEPNCQIPNIPKLNFNTVNSNIPSIPSIVKLPNQVPQIPINLINLNNGNNSNSNTTSSNQNNTQVESNNIPKIPTMNALPNTPGIPTIPGMNKLKSNSCMIPNKLPAFSAKGNIFSKNFVELYPVYREAKEYLYSLLSDYNFTPLIWAEQQINKKNSANIFSVSQEGDILKSDFLKDKFHHFIFSFAIATKEAPLINKEKKEFDLINQSIAHLFTYKELFSSKLSQCFLITTTKLQKTHKDFLQKLKEVSHDIVLEDLKAISDLFSIRSAHKSELQELIQYHERNDLELSQYRASEKFVLEVYYGLYPTDLKNELSRIEYVDARFRTWKYALDFSQNFEYVKSVRDSFLKVYHCIKSQPMADLVKLTLFYGNLLNSCRTAYKEIKAFHLESFMKLIKYSMKSNYFYDQILIQLKKHVDFFSEAPADKFCMLFDEGNTAIKTLLGMVDDFIKEYDANMSMINVIAEYDTHYMEFMLSSFSEELCESVEAVRDYKIEIETKVKELYLYFGMKDDSGDCKKMDPLFRHFFVLVTHLQARITMLKDAGVFDENSQEESICNYKLSDSKDSSTLSRFSGSKKNSYSSEREKDLRLSRKTLQDSFMDC